MRNQFVATTLAVGFIAASAGTARALAIGDPIPLPDVKMANVDGRDVAIRDVVGTKGTLVIFSCNHCPYVKAWESRLVALGNDARKEGIGVIAINSNDPTVYPGDSFEAMKDRARAKAYAFPYVADAGASELGRAFGATHTPEAFLFDTAGTLVYHGAIDDNAEDAAGVSQHFLRDALIAVESGVKPAIAETKAIGCSIALRKKQGGGER